MDELAKIMPTPSEQEQRSFIGGAHYYSASGYLGQVGPSTEIRLIDSLPSNQSGTFEYLDNLPGSKSISAADAADKVQIVKIVANLMGLDAIAIPMKDPNNWGAYQNNTIYINYSFLDTHKSRRSSVYHIP